MGRVYAPVGYCTNLLAEKILYDKMSKCEFGMLEMMYLSHMIGKDDAKIHMMRIWVTLDWSNNLIV